MKFPKNLYNPPRIIICIVSIGAGKTNIIVSGIWATHAVAFSCVVISTSLVHCMQCIVHLTLFFDFLAGV